ncbi:phosphopantetheine-binding protein [Lacimonas salitolerans]|uniref:Phosphopantetheine-binding protein n=1 Tax=Lacimonas salitolerans TaxID=1323750 RepID=A0ABW4EMU1_9RHOB
MSDTAKRVRKVIAAKFNMDEADLVSEASFVADLGADSLDIVEISMAIEKEWLFRGLCGWFGFRSFA